MVPAAGMMGGAPSYSASSSANSSANSRSGDISSSFMSGDFTVGGDKNMIWIFVIVGVVAVAFLLFRGKR